MMKPGDHDSEILASLADEIPLPEDYFRRLGIASRPTFFRWEKQGLRVLRVNSRRFIYPSDLKRFMEAKDCEAGAREAVISNQADSDA